MSTPDSGSTDVSAPMVEAVPVGDDTAMGLGLHDSLWYGPGDFSDDELVGTKLSNTYGIRRVLGQGGMGRIYEAQHTRIASKLFAIKVLRPEFARHKEARARFQREAEAAASIDSNFVVGVWDVDVTTDGRPYMACELLEGVELGHHLDAVGRLPVEQALRIARDIARGLAAAHARGVIHRDVKPENVFLTGDLAEPQVKILDFGLSKLAVPNAQNITTAGIIMGTPSYMAPETAAGKPADHRVDVYGVGLILYRALTGTKAFDDEDAASTLLQVLHKDAVPPRALNPAIPEAVERIILRAIAKEPDERFQTAAELAEALASAGLPAAPARREEPAAYSQPSLPPARPLALAVYAFAALGLLGLALAIAGVEVVAPLARRDRALTTSESLRLLVAAGGGLFGLLLIATGYLRGRQEGATSDAAAAFRSALLLGAACYGALALVIRFGDNVLGARVDSAFFGREPGAGWAGWSALLPAISLAVVAGWASLRKRPGGSRALGALLGPVVGLASLAAAAGLFYAGLSWRASDGALATADEPAHAPAVSEPATAPPPPSAPSAAPEEEQEPAEDAVMASPEDLAAAKEAGVGALETLFARHPRDPAVIAALVEEHARKPSGYPRALELAAILVEIDPEQAEQRQLRLLMIKASQAEPEVSDEAFRLLAEQMGSEGPDIVYDLLISTPSVRARAMELLARPEVRGRSSEALQIAFDLRSARDCEQRARLLDRVAAQGDGRSIVILSAMLHGTQRGCGPNGQAGCPGECAEHAEPIQGAINAIKKRIGG